MLTLALTNKDLLKMMGAKNFLQEKRIYMSCFTLTLQNVE